MIPNPHRPRQKWVGEDDEGSGYVQDSDIESESKKVGGYSFCSSVLMVNSSWDIYNRRHDERCCGNLEGRNVYR